MTDYTKYPLQIDTSNELPLTTDNVTPVKAEVVNRLRGAILAIEAELGVQPSREYSTVRSRLDALEEGGGTGGGSIELLEEGSLVASSVTSINFTGGVTLTQTSPLQVEVAVTGGQASQIQETLSVNSDGQTVFILSDTPIQDDGVQMFLNGIKLRRGSDYTSIGTSVTYSGSPSLITNDIVEFWYLVDVGGIGGGTPLEVQNEGVAVDSATTTLNFTGDFTITSISPGVVEINVTGGGGTIGNPWETTDQIINDSGAFTINVASYIQLESTGSGIGIYAGAAGELSLNGGIVDITGDDELRFIGINTITSTSTEETTIRATGGSNPSVYIDATSGEFYPSASYIYIESLGFLDMVSEDGITLYQIRRSGDLPAQTIHLQGARASASAVGATNRTGGALIFETGAATTPGTDNSGPIYVGIGEAVSTSIANGFIIGYGPAVGALGDADYVPFTTQLAKHTLNTDEYRISSSKTIQVNSTIDTKLFALNEFTITGVSGGTVTTGNGDLSLSSGSSSYLSGRNVYISASGGLTPTVGCQADTIELYSTANFKAKLSGRRANFGSVDEVWRYSPYFPADVQTTATTKIALATIAIAEGRPSTFRGSVAGWPAAGGAKYADILFHAENIGGTVTISGAVVTESGAALGTITVENDSTNAVVYVEPVDTTSYTWRCTLTEER